MNSLSLLGVLLRATRGDREKLVYALNKFGRKEFDYDATPFQLAFLDHDELVAAGRAMCEHYGENLPILEELITLATARKLGARSGDQ